jgi:PncC family amidohydrolase
MSATEPISPAADLTAHARDRVGALIRALVGAQLTMATAESLTGGLCAYLLVDEPDSGQVMLGSIVAYDVEQKQRLLGVDAPCVVSEECALQMVEGVQRVFQSSCALSFTGVAGPDTVEAQPVGTVFVGVACNSRRQALRCQLNGEPNEIRLQAIVAAVDGLIDLIEGSGSQGAAH